jgi:hypothetical protein
VKTNIVRKEEYKARLKRVNDAIALKEGAQMPVAPLVNGLPYYLYPELGLSHRSALYDFEKAMEAHIRFHLEFEPDGIVANIMPLCAKAADYLRPTMLDWPGRAGTPLPDDSIYQMFEIEYLKEDEYDELLGDYTGFILRKYLPRSYKSLIGLEQFRIDPTCGIMDLPLSPLANPALRKALQILLDYSKDREQSDARYTALTDRLIQNGFPPMYTAVGQVPFDILSDYFRGTVGTFYDQVERPDKILGACEKFMSVEIDALSAQAGVDADVKRVFFPMHKGMDSFISDAQYRDLYWAPYQKILQYLIGIGVTPIIYTEGPYETRTAFIREKLHEFPPGSCMIHFESGDFAELKKAFKGLACLTGGVSLQMLEFGTREEVVERVKFLAENCAACGGFILDASGAIEKAKRENIEAMFETARSL